MEVEHGNYWWFLKILVLTISQVNLTPNSSLGTSLNSIIKIAGTLCTACYGKTHDNAISYDNVQFNVYSMQLRLKTHRLKKKNENYLGKTQQVKT